MQIEINNIVQRFYLDHHTHILIIMHSNVYTILFQDNPVDILECLSVMINEGTGNDPSQVQELLLDDQLLGTMVTAITLPDGTQAFVTNNLNDIG